LQPHLARLSGEVLDVGCGRKPYRAFVPAARYVGLDIDSPVTRALGAADVFYDGRQFPFGDASFDGVLCSQVFEHVFNPEEFLGEIHRVLRPGGQLVLAVPFVWDEHEQPHDFARYSSFGLRALLERNGFIVEAHHRSVADSRVLFQLAAAYMYKVTLTDSRWLRHAAQLGLIAPINLAGVVLGRLLPGNVDLYLDNIVLARRAAVS
jgi:SAM-dependent methyltransferase